MKDKKTIEMYEIIESVVKYKTTSNDGLGSAGKIMDELKIILLEKIFKNDEKEYRKYFLDHLSPSCECSFCCSKFEEKLLFCRNCGNILVFT